MAYLPPRSFSGLQLDENLVIAMIVHVLGAVRVTAFAKIDLSGVERQPRRAARAIHFEHRAFDGIEKVVVVVAVSVDALAGLQREFPDAHALVLENHLGSDFGHGLLLIGDMGCKQIIKDDEPTVSLQRWLRFGQAQKHLLTRQLQLSAAGAGVSKAQWDQELQKLKLVVERSLQLTPTWARGRAR